MKINHNISAQLANVSLKKTSRRLGESLERLSTGYKINKAADDAAGLAISNTMRTQIRALDQASRNAADGDSVIQTAEGALNEIESILQRVRELTVQAASDTNTLEDRKAIQSEVDQLFDEIDRIAGSTEYNGKCLLDGSTSRTIMSNSLSVRAQYTSMEVASGTYEVTVNTLAAPAQTTLSGLAVNDIVMINGEEITFLDEDSFRAQLLHVCDAMNMDVEGNGGDFVLTTRAAGNGQVITTKINDQDAVEVRGIDAEISLGEGFWPEGELPVGTELPEGFSYASVGGKVTIKGNDGFEIQIDVLRAQAGDTATLRVENAGYMTLQIGANEHQTLDVDFMTISCDQLKLRDFDGNNLINVCTNAGATHALNVLDEALLKVTTARASLGAYVNRLDFTQESLDVSSLNLTESMSRIFDTDMAGEMTDYTQYNVLEQAATSMLAQANNRPQTIMSLLQS